MMANSVVPFDPNMMPQYAMKTTNKPLCFTLTKNYQDFFLGKIDQLANEKLKLFVRQLEKIKESKKRKSMSRRQLSSPVKKVVATALVTNQVTERLKVFIADEMKGSDMKLVIQKSLFKTDLEKDQNRLNIPINQLKTDDFLTADEKQFLSSDTKNVIKVRVLGPGFRMYEETMGLKIWNMNKNKNYVLMGNWNNFVNENKNDLKVKTLIQVWSFRIDQQLFMAIICVDSTDHPPNSSDV